MQSFKIFLTTFLSSVCIVLLSFAALYWMITPSQQSVGTNQENIPITKATAGDNKTTLVAVQTENNSIFLLIKLNAVASEVSVTAVNADFYIPHSSRTLQQSFEYAGIMQCVQDLSEHLDTSIDYHLVLDSETLSLLNASFINEETAKSIFTDQKLSAQQLENFASLTAQAIKNNMAEIQTGVITAIPKNFSWLYTNISKGEIPRIDRILTLLQRSNAEYICSILTN